MSEKWVGKIELLYNEIQEFKEAWDSRRAGVPINKKGAILLLIFGLFLSVLILKFAPATEVVIVATSIFVYIILIGIISLFTFHFLVSSRKSSILFWITFMLVTFMPVAYMLILYCKLSIPLFSTTSFSPLLISLLLFLLLPFSLLFCGFILKALSFLFCKDKHKGACCNRIVLVMAISAISFFLFFILIEFALSKKLNLKTLSPFKSTISMLTALFFGILVSIIFLHVAIYINESLALSETFQQYIIYFITLLSMAISKIITSYLMLCLFIDIPVPKTASKFKKTFRRSMFLDKNKGEQFKREFDFTWLVFILTASLFLAPLASNYSGTYLRIESSSNIEQSEQNYDNTYLSLDNVHSNNTVNDTMIGILVVDQNGDVRIQLLEDETDIAIDMLIGSFLYFSLIYTLYFTCKELFKNNIKHDDTIDS